MRPNTFLVQERKRRIAFCKRCLRKLSKLKHPRFRVVLNAYLLGAKLDNLEGI